MSDPVGDRLRSYYQSVQTDAPAGLPSRVDRALDSTPTARTVRVPWQPAGLLAAIAAIVVLALVVRNLEPASLPLPSGSAGPSTSPWSLTNLGVSAGLETGEPGETRSAVETPSADPSATPTATPTARRTLSPTLLPAPTAMPTATPFRGSGNLVRVGAMTPNLSGPAVRLRDGPVLIAGGMTVRADAIRVKTNLAELYEPGSHSFVSTGPMADARYDHTATLLADGRVLVAGGADLMDGIDNLATADIYDPLVGTFTRTGSMAQGRAGHSATLLPDGRVLIAGGYGGGTTALRTAEIFDPDTGKFTPTGSMTTARQNQTATRLPNGDVLIAGGLDADNHVLASAELYDPSTGMFHATGSMKAAREWQTATSIGDGRAVLMTGGIGANGTTALASAELYNPSTGVFSATGSMKTARYGHTAIELIYGQVIVAGGQGTASLEVYWPDTGTFGYQIPMLGPVSAAATMADRVLFTGDTPQLYCAWPGSVGPCQ